MTETAVLDTPSVALTVQPGTPLPVFSGAEMVQAFAQYKALQRALDEAMPDAIIVLDGKPFRKKQYWRALAVAFNLTVEPVTERRDVYGSLESGGDNYEWIVTYKATAPNGRSQAGDGACSAAEKQRGRMKASTHNVRSHAHTRAYNRAVSNLVGFGEVSAEETDEHDQRREPVRRTPPEQRAVENGHAADLLISDAQGKRLWAIAKDTGWTDAELKQWLSNIYGLESIRAVPRAKYEAIVEAVKLGHQDGDNRPDYEDE